MYLAKFLDTLGKFRSLRIKTTGKLTYPRRFN